RPLFAHLLAVGRWVALATGVALLVFLLLPRQPQQLNLFVFFSAGPPPKIQVGYSEQMDLNRTGLVEVDEEIAFTVQAEDAAGNPKLDLRGEQRWRGTVLDVYNQGRWNCSALMPISPMLMGLGTVPVRAGGGPPRTSGNADRRAQLADLGPEQYFLNISLEP